MIDPRAVVDDRARLADDVVVGPFSVIGAEVEIGPGCVIGSHVVIKGPTRIGRDNRIFQFASVGDAPQDKKYAGENTRLEIGERNTIREYATINRGTVQDRGETRIGNDCLLMAYTHVAHDCVLGDNVIMSNAASLGGHVHIQDWAILSGFALVHQFCQVGAHSFIGMNTAITRDVPPYLLVAGNPAEPHGINSKGLARRGFSEQAQRTLKQAYRLLYKSGLKLEESRQAIAELAQGHSELLCLSEFLQDSNRGIVR
ncbi:acyl-ACP--UDP-N-acetylglucosamine O-acyltransferase [Magnetovirga frankeli]|uniref:acyl-ACP--UDP-N-acetylglucosamine O-acyltransferase n=1 Tax=Magnetovirga frankeli TaxID=947516 RepID=UPI001292F22A|nr:acyl-ACP--UDP-N-acetylglucosamine O-acyltransferase [gamma proteobacterium SS-5]